MREKLFNVLYYIIIVICIIAITGGIIVSLYLFIVEQRILLGFLSLMIALSISAIMLLIFIIIYLTNNNK